MLCCSYNISAVKAPTNAIDEIACDCLAARVRVIGRTVTAAKGVREVRLTVRGEKKLWSVLPDWRKAQARTARLIGAPGVQALRAVAGRVWTQAPR